MIEILEYQAKELLGNFHIPVPTGIAVETSEAAERAAMTLGGPVMVKAQIYVGARGKAGGVVVCQSAKEAHKVADRLLGNPLVTEQTGKEGQRVKQVWVEEFVDIEKERYLSFGLNFKTACIELLASREGGVNVETKSKNMLKQIIDPRVGLQPFQAREVAYYFDLDAELIPAAVQFIQSVYHAFIESDACFIEINPLAVTRDQKLLAVDVKMGLDENAAFRHQDRAAWYLRESPFSSGDALPGYVPLDGNIGCIVNGAGLAMATMDMIKLHGGHPANFLDVGGDITPDQINKAFELLVRQQGVRTMLIHVFGGIVRCDDVARGVVSVAERLNVRLPIVVRMAGTYCELAQELFQQSSLNVVVSPSLRDAVIRVIDASRET